MNESLLPECATIAIGTVPHRDAETAVEFMLRHHPECPSWPQLPQADFREGMYVQYSECMPAAVVETDARRIFFDTDAAPEALASFYEKYFAGDEDFCAIGSDYSRGLEPMLRRMPLPQARYIKGHVTGPASFALTVTDENNKPILYHVDLFDAIVKALTLKGRWQVSRFRDSAPEQLPIIFYDEPYLTQIGSAMISLPPEQVVARLDECFAAIDGITGIHVCGGTDWGLLASTSVDILHFDAANHAREFLIYEQELAKFMARGGLLAWGIVPTDERAFKSDKVELAGAVREGAEKVSGFTGGELSADDILRRSFISESCGTGTLEMALAESCFTLAGEVSDVLKSQIC